MQFWKLIDTFTDSTVAYFPTVDKVQTYVRAMQPDRRPTVAAVLVEVRTDKDAILRLLNDQGIPPSVHEVGPALTFTRRGGLVRTTADSL